MSQAVHSTVESPRSCIVVLGTDQLASSAMASVLGSLGCDLSATPATEGRRRGADARATTALALFNRELLDSANHRWGDFAPFHADWLRSPLAEGFIARGVAMLDAEFGDAGLVCLDDPQIGLIVPVWQEILARSGTSVRSILVTRDPGAPVGSAGGDDFASAPLEQMVWLRAALESERATRGSPRQHVAYSSLITDWQSVAAQSQRHLDIVWPKPIESAEFEVAGRLARLVAPGAAGTGAARPALAPAWVTDTHAILTRWQARGETPDDYPELDRIKAEFNLASTAFARLSRAQSAAQARAAGVPGARAPGGLARPAASAGDEGAASLRHQLQEERRKATLLTADFHQEMEAREAAETALGEVQAELSASRSRRKEMARVINNREARIAQLNSDLQARYHELATLQRHLVRSSLGWKLKAAFARAGRALKGPFSARA